MRSTRGCATNRAIFSRKKSEKGMSIFHKNSRKGYNICKKFHIYRVSYFHGTNDKPKED